LIVKLKKTSALLPNTNCGEISSEKGIELFFGKVKTSKFNLFFSALKIDAVDKNP